MNPNGQGSAAWVISENAELRSRIGMLLHLLTDDVNQIEAHALDGEDFWSHRPDAPGLIVLDIDDDVDWGRTILRHFKRARIKAPVVVITEDFSRDFGAKIVSEGVRYYFAHDFCPEEFREVAESLLRPVRTEPG